MLFKIGDIFLKINKPLLNHQWNRFKWDDIVLEDDSAYIKINIYQIDKKFDKISKWHINKYINEMYIYNHDVMIQSKNWTLVNIYTNYTQDNVNTLLIYVYLSNVVKYHMIQMHSSLVEYNGYGVMFLGPSGIGKTTQAELWNQYLDALIINGDIVYVEDKGEEFIGWGTPWHGSSPYCENTSVPVKALIVLKQGSENSLRRLEGLEMVSSVGAQVFYPDWVEQGVELALETLDHVLKGIPVYELVNRADEESVMMVKQAVFGNEED